MSRSCFALVVAVVVAAAAPARAQPRGLDPSRLPSVGDEVPIVDLYTFGVGPVVFEKFGHAALCLTYTRIAVCFNYGATNFEEPGALIWGFMRSTQKFWTEPSFLRDMHDFYQGEDRDIFRQELPLDDAHAKQLADRLWHDVAEDNRYYVYEHFDANCTTKLRDLIDEVTDGKLRAGSDQRIALTFRELGRRGMAEFEELLVVSDFVTGRDLDVHPTEWQAMFHPEVLRQQVEEKLGVEPELMYARQGPPFPTDGPTGRPWVVVLSILFTAPLALVRWRGWRRERLAIVVACVPLMLIGVALWLIFALVTIEWVRWNEAMVLFLPLDLALPFLAPARRRRYAQIRLGMVALASALCAIGWFRQPLWIPALVAFLPLALLAFDLPPARASATSTPSRSS